MGAVLVILILAPILLIGPLSVWQLAGEVGLTGLVGPVVAKALGRVQAFTSTAQAQPGCVSSDSEGHPGDELQRHPSASTDAPAPAAVELEEPAAGTARAV